MLEVEPGGGLNSIVNAELGARAVVYFQPLIDLNGSRKENVKRMKKMIHPSLYMFSFKLMIVVGAGVKQRYLQRPC